MEEFRRKVEACFNDIQGASPEMRQLANLARLSPVPIEVPAWYLWLGDLPGAFMLECVGAGELGWRGGVSLAGNFAIRYFPVPGMAPAMASRTECIVRRSRIFEEEGVPRLEYLDLIRRRNYFAAGALSMIFPPGGGCLLHFSEEPRAEAASVLFEALVRIFCFHLRTPPALWTAGAGWQAVSYAPMRHPHGGEVRPAVTACKELFGT